MAYFSGQAYFTHCKDSGILDTGKNKPLNNICGISANGANWIAFSPEATPQPMTSAKEEEAIPNPHVTAMSRKMFPCKPMIQYAVRKVMVWLIKTIGISIKVFEMK
mmetsp:Transcript_55098/g.152609  ORF Transcript_55098/g.152609 Transcript_55098/m.152609 type:complete len:106 (+) Transcript_55098:322-639(+)